LSIDVLNDTVIRLSIWLSFMEIAEDRVVKSIHEKFNSLPAKSKPRVNQAGTREWVPLSGIAVIRC